MTKYKTCRTCQQTKRIENFYTHRLTSDGLQSECKQCSRERAARHYKAKRASMPRPQCCPMYEPTAEEIAAACAEIRSNWSERERLTRLPEEWRGESDVVPVIRVRELGRP